MKKLMSILLALIFTMSLATSAFALEAPFEGKSASVGQAEVMRAEETEWKIRIYQGQVQKRLWSVTNERWLTDWMPYETPWP